MALSQMLQQEVMESQGVFREMPVTASTERHSVIG
jgi:hypothetical protein